MTFTVNIVKDFTHEMLPPSVVLPPVIHSGLSAFHYIHGCWRWYRWGKKHLDPDNWFLIAADKGFGYLAGQNQIIQAGAQLLLIITSINECVTGYIKLFRSYQKLDSAVRGHFPRLEERPWAKSLDSVWISPSFSHRIPTYFDHSAYYTNRVAERIFKFFRAMFTLCMLQVEAINSFSLEASKRQEAVGEVFTNAVKFITQFSDNSALLTVKLQKKKVAIQKMLSYIKKGMSADDMISAIGTIAKGAEMVKNEVNQMHTSATNTFFNMAKDALYGVTHIVGASENIRKYFAPDPVDELQVENKGFAKPKEGYGRYAPKLWVTRLDRLSKNGIIKDIKEQSGESLSLSTKKVNSVLNVIQEIFA